MNLNVKLLESRHDHFGKAEIGILGFKECTDTATTFTFLYDQCRAIAALVALGFSTSRAAELVDQGEVTSKPYQVVLEDAHILGFSMEQLMCVFETADSQAWCLLGSKQFLLNTDRNDPPKIRDYIVVASRCGRQVDEDPVTRIQQLITIRRDLVLSLKSQAGLVDPQLRYALHIEEGPNVTHTRHASLQEVREVANRKAESGLQSGALSHIVIFDRYTQAIHSLAGKSAHLNKWLQMHGLFDDEANSFLRMTELVRNWDAYDPKNDDEPELVWS